MRVFAIGDIHGAYKALIQCLERSGFDYQKDRLIVLGDVCDGYPQAKKCISELLKI
ncbi:MAG: metallophosphoesterase, partial [Candidatus Omnitrophica bacterium]|nr:metallophosphoesterase [Candidatus Omnitrophota bacterium]